MDRTGNEVEAGKNDFESVASEIATDLSGKHFELCEDNYVGSFTISDKGVNSDLWFCKNLRCKKNNEIEITDKRLELIRQNGGKVLLIVLESPHIDEFNKSVCSIALAPALGMTGCYLDKYFIDEIKQIIPNEKYHVILANSIQYQCSLGYVTNKFSKWAASH